MPKLVPTDVHVDALVGNIGLKFRNKNYIAAIAAPIVAVKNKTGLYPSLPKSAHFRNEAKATSGMAPTATFDVDLTPSYRNVTYKFAAELPDEVVANADSVLNITSQAAEYSADKISLAREARVASSIFTAAANTTWTGYTTLSAAGGTQWDLTSSSHPVTNIMDGKFTVEDNTQGWEANTFIAGTETWRKLIVHPEVIGYIFGGGAQGPKAVTTENFGKAFGFEKVLIGKAVYTADQEGTAEASCTYTKLWGKNAWIGRTANSPSMWEPTAIVQTRDTFKTWTWRNTGAECAYIQCQESIDEVVVSADCGYYIFAAVS